MSDATRGTLLIPDRGRADAAVARPGEAARGDFPPLNRPLRSGVPLVYLDTAATALRPESVIRAVAEVDEEYPANVHRGLHELSERASEAYETARAKVARFIHADASELVFTRGTTESINLVAQGWGCKFLRPGDEVLLTPMEHHANLVPWQVAAKKTGAVLRFADLTPDGRLDLESVARTLSPRTRIVAVTGMSNVLGTLVPVREVADLARGAGALVLVDGAQSVPHAGADVAALGVDFLAFSAHKLYGPTGVGALWAKREWLEAMDPLLTGGGMVLRVTLDDTEYDDPPGKFEAGTPPIAAAIGFGAAVDYLGRFDPEVLRSHEAGLTAEAHRLLSEIPGVRVLGPGPGHAGGVVGFVSDDVHPHDLAQLLDRDGVAIRAGHHCAMPLHDRLGVKASARASLGLYNTVDDVRALAESVARARGVFARRG